MTSGMSHARAACVAAGALAAHAGARRRHRDPRLGRLVVGQRLAELCRDREGLLRGRRHQARSGVRAIQRRGDPAARGRLASSLDQLRPGRSDPRHREGRAARASCASRCRCRPIRCWPSPRSRASKELKGKIVSVGGAKDITRIFVERMLEPNGVKPGEFDMTFAGATSARFVRAAGRRGRCRDPDAAVQFPRPVRGLHQSRQHHRIRRHAVRRHRGEHQLGRGQQGHGREGDRASTTRASPGSTIPTTATRRCKILMKVSKIKQEDVERAYDFLIRGKYLRADRQGLARRGSASCVDALKTLGDVPPEFSGRPAVPARRHAGLRLTCWSRRAREDISPARCRWSAGLLLWELVSRAARRQPAVPGGALADRRGDLHADADRRDGAPRRDQRGRVRDRLRDRERDRHRASASAWPTACASSRRCSRGFPASTRRRPSRSRRCSSCGSASASGRRCWW